MSWFKISPVGIFLIRVHLHDLRWKTPSDRFQGAGVRLILAPCPQVVQQLLGPGVTLRVGTALVCKCEDYLAALQTRQGHSATIHLALATSSLYNLLCAGLPNFAQGLVPDANAAVGKADGIAFSHAFEGALTTPTPF